MNLDKTKKINVEGIKTKKTISLISKTVSGDWKILITTLIVFLVLGMVFSWNYYRSVSDQSFLNDGDVVQKGGLKIDTKQLDRVVENLNQKKEKFNSLTGQN